MLFLQLSLNQAPASFKNSTWIRLIHAEFPEAEIMEVDNYSEVFLYQQILKWTFQPDQQLVIHIHSTSPDTPMGNMLRFLQDILQKKVPVLVTMQGKHAGAEKYLRAFTEYEVVETEEEAVAFSLKLKA